jgi:anti-sigma factor RsiW
MSPNARDPDSHDAARTHDGSTARTHVSLIDCLAAARWLWDYVDGRSTDASRAALERHLEACARCARHVAFAHAMRRVLAELRGNYRGGIALPLTSPPAHSRPSHDLRPE